MVQFQHQTVCRERILAECSRNIEYIYIVAEQIAAAINEIVTGPTNDDVISKTAFERVIATTTGEHIVSAETCQDVFGR